MGLEHTIDDRQRRNAAAPYNLDEAGRPCSNPR
jgi:hypothetical protein